MKLLIEIPEEFENNFRKDGFKDCFERIKADLEYYIKEDGYGAAGNYELETLEMLEGTFENKAQIVEDDFVAEKENKYERRI